MNIKETETDFLSTLFNKEGTADGFVVKRNKRSIDLWIRGEVFRINKHGVWGLKHTVVGGKDEWIAWHNEGTLSLSGLERMDIAESLSLDHSFLECSGEPCLASPSGRYTERVYCFK